VDLKSYWDDRIESGDRYSSIGRISYPKEVNRYAKNIAKEPIQQACDNNDLDLKGQQVLDSGCGTGIYSKFYSDLGAEVTGFDFSESAIREIHKQGIPGNYSVQKLPDVGYTNDQFDFTHSFSVLYHILDDTEWEKSIHQLARVTKTTGHILLRIEWTDEPGRASEHYKQRSRSEYKRVFNELGLEIVDTYLIKDKPSYPRVARYFPRLTTWLDLFTQDQSNQIVLLEFR